MADLADNSDFIIDVTVSSKVLENAKKLQPNNVTDCEECEEPIGEARKKAFPSAKLCIHCAEILEKKSKIYGR